MNESLNGSRISSIRSFTRLGELLVAAALLFVFACSADERPANKTQTKIDHSNSPSPLTSSQDSSSLGGEVVAVIDGDTIEIRDQQERRLRIQLQAVDAPEPQQAFASISQQNLIRLLLHKTVSIEGQRRDPFGRIVGKVFSGNSDIGLEQIKAGLAWHYTEFADQQSETDRLAYTQAEQSARSQKLGLWADKATIAPWLFRHQSSTRRLKPSNQSLAPITQEHEGEIRGNRRSGIYHWPGCPNYDDISLHNRVIFQTVLQAESAGFRAARNCND